MENVRPGTPNGREARMKDSLAIFLVAGVLIGPNGLALLQNVRATAVLGQLGVVFLLFSIGLELSIDRLVGPLRAR